MKPNDILHWRIGSGRLAEVIAGISLAVDTWVLRPKRLTLLVIDHSESMDTDAGQLTRLEAAKSVALEYIEASAAENPANKVAVIEFDDKAELICPFTQC